MKKIELSSYAASLILHVTAVGGLVAAMAIGSPVEPPAFGVRVVVEAGEPEMRLAPPRDEPVVRFEPVEELRVEVKVEPVPDEFVPERRVEEIIAPPVGALPVSRPKPVPSFDQPVKNPSVKIAPSAATESPVPDVYNASPEYPLVARRRGIEGTVVVVFDIQADGTCVGVRVAESSGHQVLDYAVVDAVQWWKFKPATREGAPVATAHRVRFTFKLKGAR